MESIEVLLGLANFFMLALAGCVLWQSDFKDVTGLQRASNTALRSLTVGVLRIKPCEREELPGIGRVLGTS